VILPVNSTIHQTMKTPSLCECAPADPGAGHSTLTSEQGTPPASALKRSSVLVTLTRSFALGIALAVLGLHASDIRGVGQFTVNLDPIHDWMQTRKGDRPMPHWRDFTPLEYLGVINGGHAFRVAMARDGGAAPRIVVGISGDGASRHVVSRRGNVENAETKVIVLKNPPQTMLRLGMQVLDLKNKLGRAESTELAARRGAVIANGNANVGYSYYPPNSRAAASAQAARAARARAVTVRQLTAMELENLERELSRCLPLFRETHELAMFTGQIVAGREVWDCGVPRR
jgi:hypothetical protein